MAYIELLLPGGHQHPGICNTIIVIKKVYFLLFMIYPTFVVNIDIHSCGYPHRELSCYGDFLSPMQQPHSYYNAMECGIVYLFLPINARENRQKTMEKRHLEKDFA